MSRAKKAVLTAVATLALAFIIGATSDGVDIRGGNEQASETTATELMYLAAEPEHGNGGG